MATTESAPAPEKRVTDFLEGFKCASPIFPNDFSAVVRCYDNETVMNALEKMMKNRILSLPILHHKTGKPMWVLTMFDVMAFFINNFEETDFKSNFWNKLSQLVGDKFKNLANKPLSAIEETADYTLDPVYVVDEQDSLLAALQLMLKKKSHRVLVVDQKGGLANFITQSRVAQFLPYLMEKSPIGQKTLKDLKLGLKAVTCVNSKATAFSAFKTMVKERKSGLAVVDDLGKMVGTISISDFKLCGYESRFFDLLGKSVSEYLAEVVNNPESNIRTKVLSWLQEQGKPPVVVKCTANDNLLLVMRFFNFYGVHRIFIVDEQGRPAGVISLQDLLATIVPVEQSS